MGILTGRVEFQAEPLRSEDSLFHCFQCVAHPERYVGLSKHVVLQIDPGSNFDDRQTFLLQAQYATFGDVQHLLLKLSRSAATKGDVFNLRNEFSVLTLFYDPKAPILYPQVEASSCKITAE